MPPVRPLRIRRLLSAVPLTLALALAGLAAAPVPAALAGAPCAVKRPNVAVIYPDVQSAVDAVAPGSTLEVRGVCLGPVIIAKNLTLVGKGTPLPGIFGQESVRVLLVDYGATVSIRRLEIAYGLAGPDDVGGRGGGILNYGALTLTDVIVTENDAGRGGGIAHMDGTLTLDGATQVHHNRSTESGAGIWTRAAMTLHDTASVHDNTSQGWGGGIMTDVQANDDPLLLLAMHDAATVRTNTAAFSGGGILIDGFKVQLNDTASVRGNQAANGGGIDVDRGRVTLAGSSTVRGNRAQTGGGFNGGEGATLVMKGLSRMSGNTATVFGAGIVTNSDITMSGSASVRGHVAAVGAVILIGGTPSRSPVFTMKDSSRVTANTVSGADVAAVVRACALLPTFVGLSSRVKGNTPRNILTTSC